MTSYHSIFLSLVSVLRHDLWTFHVIAYHW